MTEEERRKIAGEIGETAVLALLEPYRKANIAVTDMNRIVTNHPGYDIRVDDRVRISVKGCASVDELNFSFNTRQMDFDLVVLVDSGVAIPRAADVYPSCPRSEFVTFYVVDGDAIREHLDQAPIYLGKK